MDPINIASIIVAAIAALAAWASQRSASKAITTNANVAARVELEKEAYVRARAFDVETIRRQDVELAELRKENKELDNKIYQLKERIILLENKAPFDLTRLENLLHARIKEPTADQEQQDL